MLSRSSGTFVLEGPKLILRFFLVRRVAKLVAVEHKIILHNTNLYNDST